MTGPTSPFWRSALRPVCFPSPRRIRALLAGREGLAKPVPIVLLAWMVAVAGPGRFLSHPPAPSTTAKRAIAGAVGHLLHRLQQVPAETKVGITILRGDDAAPTDHAIADTSYDSIGESFDIFIDL